MTKDEKNKRNQLFSKFVIFLLHIEQMTTLERDYHDMRETAFS